MTEGKLDKRAVKKFYLTQIVVICIIKTPRSSIDWYNTTSCLPKVLQHPSMDEYYLDNSPYVQSTIHPMTIGKAEAFESGVVYMHYSFEIFANHETERGGFYQLHQVHWRGTRSPSRPAIIISAGRGDDGTLQGCNIRQNVQVLGKELSIISTNFSARSIHCIHRSPSIPFWIGAALKASSVAHPPKSHKPRTK